MQNVPTFEGNPIQDTIEMFEKLREQVETKGATIEVLGVGTTGYAKDILKDVLHADVALVETVAHTESAISFTMIRTSSSMSGARTSS